MFDNNAAYAALAAKDSRFDGVFFVGVSSTGVYCRPVCTAKTPKLENCTFFSSAAEAEKSGYRPCLLCRPELAPGKAAVDAEKRLADSAIAMIGESNLADGSLEELSSKLGITARHMRRVFKEQFGVSPVEYLQTRRLLFAKHLLTETQLPVTDIAMAAGFGSLRRFNDIFKKRYSLSPTSIRKKTPLETKNKEGITLTLQYRPPYKWEALINFLGNRCISGVEHMNSGMYCRALTVESGKHRLRGWIACGHLPEKNAVTVTMSRELLPAATQVIAKVRHVFDLDAHPNVIAERLAGMGNMLVPGMRVCGAFNGFELAVRAVLGQQITVKAARTLAGRVAAAFGTPVDTPFKEVAYAFPSPEVIAKLEGIDEIAKLGIIAARAKTIIALAKACASGELVLSPASDATDEMEKLLSLPGIGPWTANYIAMRAMGWTDAFLPTDYGIKKALSGQTEKEIVTMAEGWRPWRAYAAMMLWNSLA